MGRETYELQRTDSFCPPPENYLLDYVKTNKTNEIRKLIDGNVELLSLVYSHPYYKTILQVACSDFASQVLPRTVETLIELGADPYSPNEHYENKQALHFAAESGNSEILKVILQNINRDGVNSVTDGGNTALHCLIKNCEKGEEEQVRCVKILLKNGIDVNKTDSHNLPPIFYAARKGKREIVNTILNCSLQEVDIDSNKFRGKSARDLIEEKQLHNNNLPHVDDSRHELNMDAMKILFSYLQDSKEEEFLMSGHLTPSVANGDNGEMTLLQLASWKGLAKAVDRLLQVGADPNKTTSKKKETPIEIAASEGYYEVLKSLLNKTSILPSNALILALKQADLDSVIENRDYNKCAELLLERPPADVNYSDTNTLLHYAVRYGGSELTLSLLRRGASLASRNKYGIMPIEDIDAVTMETHLDECLEANLEKSIENENFEAIFNYKTLMPPNKVRINKIKDEKSFDPQDLEAASTFLKNELENVNFETEAVYFMSHSSELRHLLKHPVITSFLYMKWLKLSCFFYTNLIFYLTFCFFLLLHVFVNYNVEDEAEKTPFNAFLLILLSITFTILFLRELFQILVSPKTYFLSFENWIELILILFTAMILFQKSPTESIRKQVSALVILVAAFEMVLLIGQHPKMSTNIVMLRTVSYNFFKFFIWYAILIIAFALSFHMLFKGDTERKEETSAKNSTEDKDEEQDFFIDPGLSLFKTLVMLTGEFDASDINFQLFPVTSHIIFALFIFMIAIILFNLLNGLAVSDTQMIKSNAELVGHIARIQHIAYVENMFLGNILPHSLLRILDDKCCCFSFPISKFTFLRPLASRISLFPNYLKDYKLKVLPNRQGKVVLPEENTALDDSVDAGCINDCKHIYLDGKTVKRTRNLIRERKKGLEEKKAEFEHEQRQKEILRQQQLRIDELKREQKLILTKLDILLNNCNTINV